MSKTIYDNKIKVNCSLVHDEKGYYHLVYKIVNTVNGKIYIGKHSTKDPYDDYMGSGLRIVQATKKYGMENFTKEILYCFTNEKEAYLKEEELVTQEFIDREDTYNMTFGGKGWQSGENNPMYGRCGEKNPMYGVHRYGENNPMYGKHLSQEAKDKLSKAKKGKYAGEKNPFYGKHHTQETKDKISKANKGKYIGEKAPWYGKPRSQETKNKLSEINYGEKNPNAKAILKMDEFDNIITEYGCIKDCIIQENISFYILKKIIKEHTIHNGFYFKFKK